MKEPTSFVVEEFFLKTQQYSTCTVNYLHPVRDYTGRPKVNGKMNQNRTEAAIETTIFYSLNNIQQHACTHKGRSG